jgi:hypothetical protein
VNVLSKATVESLPELPCKYTSYPFFDADVKSLPSKNEFETRIVIEMVI